MYRRVRFWSCETVGYGPTMRVKSRRSGDILHGHDSKACQRVACQLCRQQHRYQGRGMKRTIFLLVETRRTNRQSSRPSVVTEMSSTIVTQSYWHSCTPRCLHKQRILLLRSYRSQGRLNKSMEGKCDHQIKQNNGKENVFDTCTRCIPFPRTSRARYPRQEIM